LNKKRVGFIKFFSGLILISIFLFILNLSSPQIKNYFFIVSNPAESKFWVAGQTVAKTFDSVLKSGSLLEENYKLKNENHRLLSQIIFLQAEREANQAQTEILNKNIENNFDLVLVDVMGIDIHNEITINKGSDDGILENMPVINQQNILFGKVSKVYKNFSKVTLISDKNSVVNVKVKQDQNIIANIDQEQILSEEIPEKLYEIYGVIKGKENLQAYLDLVKINDELNQGDVLVTSSLENTFPKDLLVGKVSNVKKNDQSPHQQAEIDLFFDIKTDNLFVIKNYKR
jgi:rod shape-determining protein MreC